MEFIAIIVGFVLLIKASDYFVDASTAIAKIFNVSEIIIGATIVSIGTTLPETMVSATSAFTGHGDIAFGNALGSIICNTALISAISMIFAPNVVNKKALKMPVVFFFTTFAFYAFNAYVFNGFSRLSGIVLISIFVLYVIYIIASNKNNTDEDYIVESEIEKTEAEFEKIENGHDDNRTIILKSILILIASATVIAFASNMLVDNGTLIAKKFGVPESVIGITMLALGTSLPELSTAITSIIKGHSNLSLGNIIGANFFNLVLVSGVSIVLRPFKIPSGRLIAGQNASLVVDVPIALIVMLILCLPPLILGKTKRYQGIILLAIYILFIIYQFRF